MGEFVRDFSIFFVVGMLHYIFLSRFFPSSFMFHYVFFFFSLSFLLFEPYYLFSHPFFSYFTLSLPSLLFHFLLLFLCILLFLPLLILFIYICFSFPPFFSLLYLLCASYHLFNDQPPHNLMIED